VNKTGAQTFQKYGPALRTGCGSGGYVEAQACAVSGNTSAWLFEISEWGNLPKNLSDYHAKWYHNALPLYLSAVKATRINVSENPGSGVVPTFPENDTSTYYPIASPSLKITARPIPEFGDPHNGFLVAWDGSACENIAYAKAMGYDYVMYMSGMENCPGPINLKFYIEAPHYFTPQWEIDLTRNYTQSQIDSYENWFSLKSNGSFPGNIATGWFHTKDRFRPIPDLQRQDVIDYLVVKALNEIEKRENPSKGFYFGGWSWDVPQLDGDFWSDLQKLDFYPSRANGTGRQVTISYWTGTCSGIVKGNYTTYPCFRDGYAAYYKKLFSETAKYRPGFSVYLEPYNMWSSYVRDVVNRPDAQQLRPTIMCSESAKIDFLTDPRILSYMPATDLCSDTPDSSTHVKNLDLAGQLAVKGAWFNWYGRIGGTGDFAPLNSMREVPARLKMIRVLPAWDNLNGVPLNLRSFNSRIYESTESYADLNLIYSRNPKNSKIYAVVLNSSNVGIPGNYVAYKLNDLMVPTSEVQAGSFVNGRFYLSPGAYILSENNVTYHANNSENLINNTKNISETPKPKPEIIVNKTPEIKEFSEFREFILKTKVNLTDKQKRKAIKDLVIQRGKSSIDFSGKNIDLTGFNESAVEISEYSIYVDSENFPALDVPARLTFGNVPREYALLRNGVECRFPQCNVVSHDSGYLVVDVRGFSNYTVVVGYGYQGTYVKQDLQDIMVDGLGTFGASFVSWIEILVLLGVIALGVGLVTRYKK
jgi:hypothetical protein